jgi:hypothetical protein
MDIGSFKVSSNVTPTVVSLPAVDPTPKGMMPAPLEEPASEAQAPQQIEAQPEASTEANPQAAEPAKAQQSPTSDTRFSALAKKEAALHRQREQIKADKAAIEDAARRVAEFESVRSTAKMNPIKALESLGLTYDQVTEFVMNGNKPTVGSEVESVRAEIEKLRSEQEEARRAAEERAQAQVEKEYESVIENFKSSAERHVEENKNRYELTVANNGSSLVYEVVEQHFNETGKLLPLDEAAGLVESYFEGIADRIVASSKIQARIAPKPVVETKPAPTAASTPAPKRTATISNNMTASSAVSTSKPRTESDRVRAALARLNGN